jgi:hypothetical protein
MGSWHPEARDGLALKVELDEHDGLFADDPTVVSRFDGDNLWRLELQHASIGVLDMELSADDESHVRVHAQVGADDRLHVLRPPEPGRVHHPFYPPGPCACDLERDLTDVAPFRSLDPRQGDFVATLRNAGRLPGFR